MIVTHLIGGLGNQLFQYAAGRRLALKVDTELKLDLRDFVNFPRKYVLDKFCIQADFAAETDFNELKVLKEPTPGFHAELLNASNQTYLHGYWICEKYFADIGDVLRKDFLLKNPWSEKGKKMAADMEQDNCSVSVHIRRGDYYDNLANYGAFAICSLAYYYEAIKRLQKISDRLHLYIFSDDIDWVKKYFKSDYRMTYVSEQVNDESEELWLMSLCKYHIISNSTFSWWGAWLDSRTDKIVIRPNGWVRFQENQESNEMFPMNWQVVCAESGFTLETGEVPSIRTVYIHLRNNHIDTALKVLLRLLENGETVREWCFSLENVSFLIDFLTKQENRQKVHIKMIIYAALEALHRFVQQGINFNEAYFLWKVMPGILKLDGTDELKADFCGVLWFMIKTFVRQKNWQSAAKGIDFYLSLKIPQKEDFYELAAQIRQQSNTAASYIEQQKTKEFEYRKDILTYQNLNMRPSFAFDKDTMFPCLDDKGDAAGTVSTYLWQDLWASKHIFSRKPKIHYDIGSRVDGFVTHLLSFSQKVCLLDIRPLPFTLPDLTFSQCDATNLSGIEDDSIESLSALCSLEHFGLGRYGDPIRPEACFECFAAIQKKMKKGGRLYISVPIGKEHVEYNAHRVFRAQTIVESFAMMRLLEFAAALNDIIEYDIDIHKYDNELNRGQRFGLFLFEK